MKDFEPQFRVVSELQRLAERAFVFKLKKRRPGISDGEMSAEIARWYLTRDDVAAEDYFVRRTDLSKFKTERT